MIFVAVARYDKRSVEVPGLRRGSAKKNVPLNFSCSQKHVRYHASPLTFCFTKLFKIVFNFQSRHLWTSNSRSTFIPSSYPAANRSYTHSKHLVLSLYGAANGTYFLTYGSSTKNVRSGLIFVLFIFFFFISWNENTQPAQLM